MAEKIKAADLRDQIEKIACQFTRYGYRRITHTLKRQGTVVNHKKVLRIMREDSLLCVRQKSPFAPPNPHKTYLGYPNLIKGMTPRNPNQIWLSDITYIRIPSCFIYLAAILDGFSRKVIGYCLSRRPDVPLALTALQMAFRDRRPMPGVIHHSDQGIQYSSIAYVGFLKEHGFRISMSSKGNPYENAAAESFMKTLKYEEVYLSDYETIFDVKERVPYFIQEVYNKKRLHSSLGYMPPDEYEARYFDRHEPITQNLVVPT